MELPYTSGLTTSWGVYKRGGLVKCLANQRVALRLAEAAPGDLFQMQNLRLHLRPAEL